MTPPDIDPDRFRFRPGRSLADYPTRVNIDGAEDLVAGSVTLLAELQEKLWADNRRAVLLIFQGMDTAGKDGTIKRVTSGVNPAGFQVFSFRQPSAEELDHNFLWRYWRRMPERGRIGIFNRSYYEAVVVERVHPAFVESSPLPHEAIGEHFWAHRLEDITAMERHLWRNGTTIVKFFLHLSREEQRQRLIARLENREKLWKFNPGDVRERQYWFAYQAAYDAALARTDHDLAPWYVIPADDKWSMRAVVSRVVTDTLSGLDIRYPEVSPDGDTQAAEALKSLRDEVD
jgi:PPK2 family polyphosphate:nucleotide phosphotransferase